MCSMLTDRTGSEGMQGISHDGRLPSQQDDSIAPEQSLARMGTEADTAALAMECVWCTPRHLVSAGRLPATSGLCRKAFDEQMSILDRVEAGQSARHLY